MKRAFAATFGAALIVGLLAVSLGSSGLASADFSGQPTLVGGFFADDNQVLVFNGYLGWGGAYSPITNGSQVYAGTFALVLYFLSTSGAIVVHIGLEEHNTWYNQTTSVTAGTADEVTVNLQDYTAWTPVKLVVGGTPQFYSVAVPISLLPAGIANVGGLDLLSLAIISECLISLAGATALAYWAMRKALWAPKFTLLFWGHLILLTVAGAVLLDFQFVDSIFAGWSPLFYAIFLFPIFWAFALSYFNRAPKTELLRANAPLSGRLSFNRWTFRICRDHLGRLVVIDPTWRGFWARLLGHHVVLLPEEAAITKPEPFIADVKNYRITTRHKVLRRVRRPSPNKSSPTDDFDLIPTSPDGRPQGILRREEQPAKLMFTPVGTPVRVEWPRLTIHKEVLVPSVTEPLSGNVIVPEHYVKKLSLPHYTEGHAELVLHSIHYRAGLSVVAGWRSMEDLALVLSETAKDLEMLKASFETEVAKQVRERLLAREALLGRGTHDLDEVEAAQEAEREKNTSPSLDQLFGRAIVASGRELHPTSPAEARKKEKK